MAGIKTTLERLFNLPDQLRGVKWYDLMVDANGIKIDVDVAVTISSKKSKPKKNGDDEDGDDEDGDDTQSVVKKLRIVRFQLMDQDRCEMLYHHRANLNVSDWDGIEEEFHEQITISLRAWAKKKQIRRAIPPLDDDISGKPPKMPRYW